MNTLSTLRRLQTLITSLGMVSNVEKRVTFVIVVSVGKGKRGNKMWDVVEFGAEEGQKTRSRARRRGKRI